MYCCHLYFKVYCNIIILLTCLSIILWYFMHLQLQILLQSYHHLISMNCLDFGQANSWKFQITFYSFHNRLSVQYLDALHNN